MNEEEQAAYKLGNILPLWADGGGYMHYSYDLDSKDYIAFDIEDGIVSDRYSWDQLTKELIDKVMEFQFYEYNDFDKTASAVKEILAKLKNKNFELLIQEIKNEWDNS